MKRPSAAQLVILLFTSQFCFFGLASGQPFAAVVDLADLDGDGGIILNGDEPFDESGRSVAGAGDVNGDGIDDLIIGARLADPNGNSAAGKAYVVFGSGNGLPSPIELSVINGLNGFVLTGELADDTSGWAVSPAGDINGDGVDDLIVGAPYSDPDGLSAAGRSYLVFGSDGGIPNPFQLSTIDGSNGFVLEGEAANDQSGFSVSGIGDINDDGVDDLIIGAFAADPNGMSSGRSYVVFGSQTDFPSPFNLASINGLNGFVLDGESESDLAGVSVSAAGDFNGDGINDLVVGAPGAPFNQDRPGRIYVVYGSGAGLPNPFDLSTIDGVNGLVIRGESVGDRAGFSVGSPGDINGDGIDDLLIGAFDADPNGTASGRSYVVFGSAPGPSSPFDLSTINGLNGFVLDGEAADHVSGFSVGGAGDINGDGILDILVGARGASPNGQNSGRSYVVFGSDSAFPNPFPLSMVDGSNGFVLDGDAADDGSGWSVSSSGDINGDGTTDLVIGAPLADPNGDEDAGRSYIVFGIGDRLFSDRFQVD